MEKINLSEKLTQFKEHWRPHVIAQLNGNDVMVAKFLGEFPWHHHQDTDDFFLVLQGEVLLDVEGNTHRVGPGELFVVPAGVEHRPRAEQEAHVMLIERAGTPNTGNAATAVTKPTI